MRQFFYFLIVVFFTHSQLYAQKSTTTDTVKKVITNVLPKKIKVKKPNPISQEFNTGIQLNTDGWTMTMERGFMKLEEPVKTNFFWIDISEKRHPKERKTTNEVFSTFNPKEPKPLPYKYGKINTFYPLKIGVGFKRPISMRLDNKSVLIHYVVGAGFSFGFLKPYYLQLFTDTVGNSSPIDFEKYSTENARRFLNLTSKQTIIGGADFTKGLSEFELKFGIHAKAGFVFDYAFTKKSFTSVELGTSMEIYPSKVPIMATVASKFIFLNLYANIRLGRRWAKPLKEDYEVDNFDY